MYKSCVWAVLALSIGLGCLGCKETRPPVAPPPAVSPQEAPKPAAAKEAVKPAAAAPEEAPTRWPAARRVVAIGDIHGDLSAFLRALRLSGLVDAQEHWAGGDSVFVQTGDVLDRGDDERAILALLDRLEEEARAEGGRVIRLNGNHEIMNVAGDLRYVTPGGFADFQAEEGLDLSQPALQRLPEVARARMAAFLPGGRYARRLSRHNVVVVVGDSVFVHGGVMPEHVQRGLEVANRETRRWMLGEREAPPEDVTGEESLVWNRRFSKDTDAEDCALLKEALAAIPARRLVVGHTPQLQGITQACDGAVWRVDVGMASHYGGSPQALLIEGGEVKILTEGQKE